VTLHALAPAQVAGDLLSAFYSRTGTEGEGPSVRYLWTDAFAVGAFLGLARETGDARQSTRALRLVDAVHHTLGRHRADDPRRGWLSGLDEEEGQAHPTRGGLRIGKPLAERPPGVPIDEALEWERDGQYFHYLTKWMQALDLAARHTRTARFNLWARELAHTACAAFALESPGRGGPVLAWKMSIDLRRPLVPSVGQHDALDGFVTCTQLRAGARALASSGEGPTLDREIAFLAALIHPDRLYTEDPLGIGGLLLDASRLDQLREGGDPLAARLFSIAAHGAAAYFGGADLRQPASRRLAFRELGLALGLRAAERRHGGSPPLLSPFLHRAGEIEAFWLDPVNRQGSTWAAHRDINDVMLATSLAPEGWVTLPALQGS
jgi:hypothetical protein